MSQLEICPACNEVVLEYYIRDEGVGWTHVGDHSNYHSKIEYGTECCDSDSVYIFDSNEINPDLVSRYLRRYGYKGEITSYLTKVKIEDIYDE